MDFRYIVYSFAYTLASNYGLQSVTETQSATMSCANGDHYVQDAVGHEGIVVAHHLCHLKVRCLDPLQPHVD